MAKTNSSRRYSEKDKKLLWACSAGLCNYPPCRQECFSRATDHDAASPRIGKISHMVASSDDGPRGDPSFPREKLDAYENLLLLCANHADMIDAQENTFPIATLREWKREHEKWVHDSLQSSMVSVGFKDLEVVCSFILSAPAVPETNFKLTNPSKKMKRNGLRGSVRVLLDMGAAKGPVVQHFIQSQVEVDYEYPERLKAGFLAEYYKLYSAGTRGNDLFESLRAFASGGGSDFHRAAAGLAVLSYLFQTCEVFER